MHEIYLKHTGSNSHDVWTITDNTHEYEMIRRLSPAGDSKTIFASSEFELSRVDGPVSALVVKEGFDGNRVIEVLSHFPTLEYLSIPSDLVSCLAACGCSQTLTVLEIQGSKVARFPRSTEFSRLERLIGSALRFDVCRFPSLQHLDFRGDAAGLRQLAGFDGLVTLNIQGLVEESLLDYVDGKKLSFLGLRGGNYGPDIWCRFIGLSGLWVQDLRGILDIRGLQDDASLKELTIGYCPRIHSLDVIPSLKSLERLHLFGCGEIGYKAVRDQVERMELRELRVDGTS